MSFTEAVHWDFFPGQSGSCGFLNRFYVISDRTTNTLQQCDRMNTAGHNFAYQVEMTIMQGDSGAMYIPWYR